MDIRILRYFLAVAKEENITRAAESLHIAQPSLSKQIMELESELGKKLLIRGKRKVTLTDEGVLLRKRAEDIVALVEKTEREIVSDCKVISGEITIGGNTPRTLLQAASSMQKKYPDVLFQFYSGDATDVTERLDHGNLDFAILIQPIDDDKYEYIRLPDKSLWGILMKRSSEYAELTEIRKEQLVKMPLILHRRIGLQRMIADWADTDIGGLNVTATYNVIHGSPITFVENNMRYFLTTRDLLAPKLDDSVVFRPLYPRLEVQYNLVWKRQNVFSAAARAFLEKVKSFIQMSTARMAAGFDDCGVK